MKDTVTYRLPLAAFLIHRLVIMKQLREIFLYRALDRRMGRDAMPVSRGGHAYPEIERKG